MEFRHLDYPAGTPIEDLGAAALDDLLDRGDLADWAPLARAIAGDPDGRLASTVFHLCDAHPMYGTSDLWRTWITGLRSETIPRRKTLSLANLRRRSDLTQSQLAARVGMSQSDLSKVERRRDLRLSTLRAMVAATGGRLRLFAEYSDETVEVAIPPDA